MIKKITVVMMMLVVMMLVVVVMMAYLALQPPALLSRSLRLRV